MSATRTAPVPTVPATPAPASRTSPRRGGPRLVCCASWRSQKRWTQAEFGASLGVSRQTVIAIENGKYDPSLGLAFKIASVFGKRIEDVFYPDPDGQGAGR